MGVAGDRLLQHNVVASRGIPGWSCISLVVPLLCRFAFSLLEQNTSTIYASIDAQCTLLFLGVKPMCNPFCH